MNHKDRGMSFQSDPHFVGMDRFVMFFGVVEDRNDPLRVGRCRVRILGIHPDDKEQMPTEDLPWAYPVMPVLNSPASSSTGYTPVGPAEGTYVMGFFADGMERQIPMLLGTMSGGDGQFKGGDQCGQGGAGAAGDGGQPISSGPPSQQFWTLVAMAACEAGVGPGREQDQADVAQSIYNRAIAGAKGGYSNGGILGIMLARGQYESAWRWPKQGTNGVPNPEWNNITDANSAAKATNIPASTLMKVARALKDTSLQENARKFIGARTDFLGVGQPAKAMTANGSKVQRTSKSNQFGFSGNYRGTKGVAQVPEAVSGYQLGSGAPTAPAANNTGGQNAPASNADPNSVLNFTSGTGDLAHFKRLPQQFQDALIAAGREYLQRRNKKLTINSSRRSPEEQQVLINKNKNPATKTNASGTVGGANTSPHVRGFGVDIQEWNDPVAREVLAKYKIDWQGIKGDEVHFNYHGPGSPSQGGPSTAPDPGGDGTGAQNPDTYGCSTVGNAGSEDHPAQVDPTTANSPTTSNGSLAKRGTDAANLFMQAAKKTGKMDFIHDYHVAAIMGNMAMGTGFRAVFADNSKTDADDPPKLGDKKSPYGGEAAYGFGKWTNKDGRLDNFLKYCEKEKLDPRSPAANVGYIVWELLNYPPANKVLNAIKKGGQQQATDPNFKGPWDLNDPTGVGFTGYWCGEYEQPGEAGKTTLTQRKNNTAAILAAMRNTGVPPRGAAR